MPGSSTLIAAALVAAAAAPAVTGAGDLSAALERYRALAREHRDGVPPVGPRLRVGSRHPSVAAIRGRLAATGDLGREGSGSDAARFDAAVARGLRRFQGRHGLAADGVLGPATRAALAMPLAARVEQLEEAAAIAARPSPARRWIRVNVPRFWLEVLDGDAVVLEMPVVVGRPSRPTPALESAISWIQLNPPWTVPPLLAYEDLLPRIRRDPSYLASRRIEVLDGWRPDARRIDPTTIDWTTIGAGIRDLTLRQRPGGGNPLGRVLFYMDNAHDVYLHDTPARELFRRARRDLSSGCIRVADALGLVREILRGDAHWTPARLDAALRAGQTVAVEVAVPMPIRIVHQHAWVDADGLVHFRDDGHGEADTAGAADVVARAGD